MRRSYCKQLGFKIHGDSLYISPKDISEEIKNENLVILDRCEVVKNKNNDFTRYVWVCE